mmetsp:Transcript_109958/g.206091  ORF Transcript_109958/g.206091 Transcript_109958/m.206091 type:complete len:661 (+) Transcript_109958:113-2095(+)
MGALAPLNLLVILNTHVPEALGEVRREEELKQKLQEAAESGDAPRLKSCENGVDESMLHPSGGDGVASGSEAFRSSSGLAVPAARATTAAAASQGGGNCATGGTAFSFGGSASAAIIGAMGLAAFGTGNFGPGVYGNTGNHESSDHSSTGFDDNFSIAATAGQNRSGENSSSDSSGSSSSSTAPAVPPQHQPGPPAARHQLCQACQWICPDMVLVPRSVVERTGTSDGTAWAAYPPTASLEERSIRLVMSYDNIAALMVISALTVLGAIYLWKICTRRRCTCRMCQNQYRTLHLLGSGGYGSVYLVQRLYDGNNFVAKKIPVRDVMEVDEYSREAKELVTLRHRHIVSYEDDFVHVEYGTLEPKTEIIIIMEYCPEGDLKEKIELDFYNFTSDYVRTVFAQVLQAVQYLHSKNVIHRDLKSQNVFLAHDGRVRLGDFGLCRHARARELGSATMTHAGTDCYMAPEIFSSSRYGKPADVWSLGCILYELCSGQFMWEIDGILGAMVMKDSHCVKNLVQANIVPAVDNALASLMRRLLNANPAARPTVTQCIRKKLFKRTFPLSRQTFGESLPEVEGGNSNLAEEKADTPPGQRRSGGRSTPQNRSGGGAASNEKDSDSTKSDGSESSSSDEDDAPVEFATRNDDLPKRKRRYKRRVGVLRR